MDTEPKDIPAVEGPTAGAPRICMDIPLFIKVLEYCREEATSDVELHRLLTNAIEMNKKKECLDMVDYMELVRDVKGNELEYLKKLAGLEITDVKKEKGLKKAK